MAQEIVLPQWGMEMQDATVVKWLKQEGEPVQAGEPLVEIETAKIETELESTASGVLAHILVPEGSTVPVRTALAIVAAPGEQVPRPPGAAPSVSVASATPPSTPSPAASAPPRAPAPGTPQVVPAARRLAQERGIDLAQVQGTGPGGRILLEDVQRAIEARSAPAPAAARVAVQVTPVARRLAQDHGIDLSQVQGSGPRGRIVIEDVQRAIGARAQPAEQPAQTVPLRGMRQTIAARMLQSLQSMAQVTLTTEADVTDAMRLRQGLARQWKDGGLSPLHLVIKATARALKEHPRMNAIQKAQEIELVPEIHIGVAVSLPEGLIVPTLRQADAKPLAQIAREAQDLANRAREGKATYDEVTGGTFTITNLGPYEIDAFTPIINPPQVGILGVGRVVEKPVVYEGEIAKRSMMFLSLTFDHRVIDGAPAAEFLRAVKGYLEDPWWMVASG
ncbi:MAG TPA: 2-oxo acid dehydrogenase subunit E2 [Alphaproteobacteria bacterium]|nr:2-oxo acid dehydrogenase subunit E2 [Alphaproteobacteria bacterium]